MSPPPARPDYRGGNRQPDRSAKGAAPYHLRGGHSRYSSARAVADRLVMLQEGNVLLEGTFEDFKQSREPFVAQFLVIPHRRIHATKLRVANFSTWSLYPGWAGSSCRRGIPHRQSGIEIGPHILVNAQFQNVAGLEEGADVRVVGIPKARYEVSNAQDSGWRSDEDMELAKKTLDVVKQAPWSH